MCVIIELKQNQMFPEKALTNAISNNSDGVGIVYSDGSDIRVERHLLNKPDPDFVMKLLEKDKNTTRFLHLRNRTRGDVNKENLHPFPVINDKNNSLYLMHNGTFQLGTYSSAESDSKIFAETIVKPILERLKFKNGYIDLDDPIVKLIFSGYVKDHNKVLLMNRGGVLKLGTWMEYSNEGESWGVSNLSYFNNPSRSPYRGASYGQQNTFQGHNRNTAPTKEVVTEGEEEVKATVTPTTSSTSVETKVAEKATLVDYYSNERGVTSLSFIERRNKDASSLSQRSVAKVLGNRKDIFSPSDFIQLCYIDLDELTSGAEQTDAEDLAYLIRAMAAEIEELTNDLDVEKAKRSKAQFKIEELQKSVDSSNKSNSPVG